MLAKKIASKLLSSEDGVMSLEFWNCRKSGGNPFEFCFYV